MTRKAGNFRRTFSALLERGMVALIHLCGVSSIIFVFGIFYFVFREGAPFLRHLDLAAFLGSPEWYPTSASNPRYGISALLSGTGSVTIIAMAVAVPFSLGMAIFIAEFCGKRTKEVMKVLVELLAAIPSVVWGFIGLMMMNPLIVKQAGYVPVSMGSSN